MRCLSSSVSEGQRLRVDAVEDGQREQPGIGVAQAVHQAGDLLGLLLLGAAAQHEHRVAALALRPHALVLAGAVLADQQVGEVQDLRRRAVVLLQLDDARARKIALEVEEETDAGAAPGIDGLIVVADHGDAAAVAAQQPDQFVLVGVGVLELVHQQVAEALLVPVAHRVVVAQQHDGKRDQVLVVPELAFLLRGVVAGEYADLLVVEALLAQELAVVGVMQPHLGQTDAPQQGVALAQQVGETFLEQAPEEPMLLVVVHDLPLGIEAQGGARFAQDAQPQGVESGDGEELGLDAGQGLDAHLHFVGRLVGKGDGQHLPGRQSHLQDQVGDLVGDHPRLARAGAGDDEQGRVEVQHRLPLLGIEARQDVSGHGNGSWARTGRRSGWSSSACRWAAFPPAAGPARCGNSGWG